MDKKGLPMSWLKMHYFVVATLLMGIVQFSKVAEGDGSLIGAFVVSLAGGLFWGAIATAVSKMLRKNS